MLRNEIINVLNDLKSLNGLSVIKTKGDLVDRILIVTSFLNKFKNVRISERIYCVIHTFVDRPKCKECKKNYLKYISFNVGYSKFCCYRCSSLNKETQIKCKKTSLQKYGKEWFIQTDLFRTKSENTFLRKYGLTNYSKTSDFKKRIDEIVLSRTKEERNQISKKNKETKKRNHGNENYNNRKKFKQTMMDRYGVESSFRLSNRYYSKISQNLFWNIYNNLPENLKTSTYFAELNNEYKIRDLDNNPIYIDFIILDINFGIEFNGDIYHGNPKIFQENDKPNFFYKNLTCKQIWEKDKKRISFIEEKGFKILIVWEEEYLKKKEEVIKNCLNLITKNPKATLNKLSS
jgi:G:T-mismatch repair DNA endonuclease (very short patch repair protein)